MSIRLRLTLLYSAILALTLLVFGVALYSIQATDTLNALKRDLRLSSQKLVEAALRIDTQPDDAQQEPPPPKPFDEFSNDQAFYRLREREIARILDAEGAVVASPFGRTEDALPLSTAGLAALQNQQEWWESDQVTSEAAGETLESMLIYSRPVVRNGELMYIVQVARSLTERNRTLRSLALTLGGAGLLTILLAFGAGWVISGLTLRPIHRITQTAQAIGDERDFTRRVAYTGPQDEVGRLASTFNQMLARLQDAYQKVEHALNMQRTFVADVSHELRTPLTTLRGNLGLLRRDPPAPVDEQADILADMVEESDRLIRLVNDLLLLARADAGRSLHTEPLAIRPVLEETVRQARQLDATRQIILDAAPELSVLADRDAFKQVMLIVLDNALKHAGGGPNQPGGEIAVQACAQGARVEIRVRDDGMGIPPEKLERVFDRFYRGDEPALTPGFGLGLPIAKALVEGMGGDISIESELAHGSVVILRFATADLQV